MNASTWSRTGGAVLRPGTVDELARAAGFRSAEVVGVDAGSFRLYRLDG